MLTCQLDSSGNAPSAAPLRHAQACEQAHTSAALPGTMMESAPQKP